MSRSGPAPGRACHLAKLPAPTPDRFLFSSRKRLPLFDREPAFRVHSEQHGANTVVPLDDATWKSVLAAARHSAREDNHPALQKAKPDARPADGMVGAASMPSFSTTRAPGFGFSSRVRSMLSYSAAKAPNYGFSSPAASVSTYSTTRAPGYGFSSPAASASSYSSTRAPGFGYSSSQNFVKQHSGSPRPREQPTPSGTGYSASYRLQPLRAGRPAPPSYSSAYASEPVRVQQQTQEEDAEETTTRTPSSELYSNQDESDDESQAQTTEASEDGDAERFADPQGTTESAPYRAPTSDDAPQHVEEENQYSNEAVHDDEKDEGQDDEQRDEEGGAQDSEHNPDDDHEAVPEQALQGSQLRHEHEALQVAPELRAPQLHVHHLQESQQLQSPQVREPGLADASMDHLLGPAWTQVASHSALFDGDFPLFRQNLRQEETPQDTQDAPTWTQRERADRTKGRRGAGKGQEQGHGLGLGLGGDARGRAKGSSDRGTGRFAGSSTSRGSAASFGSGDRKQARGAIDAVERGVWSSAAPSSSSSTESTWSYGSKVRGKEDAAYPQPPAPSSKRGKNQNQNQNRGPVLFAQQHQQVEASTPAGDRRLPPRGYAPPSTLPQDDKAAWLQARQQRLKPSSYSGWVPVTASLQAADSYRDPPPVSGRPGAPRGRRRAPSKPLGVGESPRASGFWKESWF